MVATSGGQLLPEEAVKKLTEELLPITTVLTPNVPEAKLLLSNAGQPVLDLKSIDDLVSLAKDVQALGPRYVLIKGGHVPFKNNGTVATSDSEKERMVDVLYGEEKVVQIESPYQDSKNTHGTGCSLACESIFCGFKHR